MVAAVAHDEATSAENVRSDVVEFIITPVLQRYNFALPKDADIIINGTGAVAYPWP